MRQAGCIVIALACLVPPAQAVQPASDAHVVMERVWSWLESYEPELSAIVADEELTQIFHSQTRGLRDYGRKLHSTVSFMRLPGGGAWLGLREVRSVDNVPQRSDGPGLLALLSQPPSDAVAIATSLAYRNARHNLGMPRTTNVPTLPLELMHPTHRQRFAFTHERTERVDGAQTARLAFVEEARPTLIRSPDGKLEIRTRGTLWIEPQTGRLRRAAVEAWWADVKMPHPEWTLTVTFADNANVGLLVPKTLRETFVVMGGRGEGDAKYSNVRRFTTGARVLPPRLR